MRCWCGYLSGARCRLFAYVPAVAIPKPRHLLPHLNPDRLYLSGNGLLGCPGKEAVKWVAVVIHCFILQNGYSSSTLVYLTKRAVEK